MRRDDVESWAHLQELLFGEMWNESLGRFRSDEVFRGEGRASNELTTSLQRLGGPYADLERHLLRNFRKYAHRDAVQRESTWHWLALAKHHGLPTRLLDWSHSPYVALHFATENPAVLDEDGIVWAVDYVRAATHLPAALRSVLDEEGSNTFTAEMIDRAATTLSALDGLADGNEEFIVFYEPPSLDDRITNQFAAFSFMSNASGASRRVARRPPRPPPPRRDPRRAQARDPRQARPGQRDRACPLPRSRRNRPLARPALFVAASR